MFKQVSIVLLCLLLLAIAGSDGPLFPWPNLAAGLLFVLIGTKSQQRNTKEVFPDTSNIASLSIME